MIQPVGGKFEWRQGSVMRRAHAEAVLVKSGAADLDQFDILMVASHDCDVGNDDFEKEPTTELLVARFVGQRPDGNLTFGKNPRKLHLQVGGPDGEQWYEVSMKERIVVPRQMVVAEAPDAARRVDSERARNVGLWLAYRYRRSAFPDEFNRRVALAFETTKSRLKQNRQHLTAIYVAGANAELASNIDYRLIVLLTMQVDDYNDPLLRAQVQEAADEVSTILGRCDGIVVSDCEVRSEAEVTLDDLRLLKRWDAFDTLSLRDASGGEMSADA